MKRIRQLLAIIGIILLVSLYVITLVLALTDSPGTMDAFRASLYCTVLVPVLIWAYTFIYKLLKNNYGNDQTTKQINETGDESNHETDKNQ